MWNAREDDTTVPSRVDPQRLCKRLSWAQLETKKKELERQLEQDRLNKLKEDTEALQLIQEEERRIQKEDAERRVEEARRQKEIER